MARRKRRRVVLLSLVAVYLLVMIFGGCADHLILFPPRGRIDAGRATRLLIPHNGGQIEIWTARPRGFLIEPQAYVLEICGNATRAEQIAQYVADRWAAHSIEAWTVNYPGYGGSTEPKKLKLIPPAALAAYDELKKRAGERPIFLEANSLGTTAALYVAANRPVAGLVLQNPPPLRRVILGKFGWWNLWLLAGPIALQVPPELNSLNTAPRVTAPAVFLLADSDELVQPKYQRLVVDAYAGPKRIVALTGADHNASVSGAAEEELRAGIDWLWSSARLSR